MQLATSGETNVRGTHSFGAFLMIVEDAVLLFWQAIADASMDLHVVAALVWTVIVLEVVRGVLDDLYLIARGRDAVFYGAFIVVHLVIVTTSILFARRALRTHPLSGTDPS